MSSYIRHRRNPEAPPRRHDHPTFGREAGSSIDRRLSALRERWSRLRSKTAPLIERLVQTAGAKGIES